MIEYTNIQRSMYVIYDIAYTLNLMPSIPWGLEHSIPLRKKKKSTQVDSSPKKEHIVNQ